MQSEGWPEKSYGAGIPTTGSVQLSRRLPLQGSANKNLRKAAKAYSNLATINPF
jgi:hypothetical protein